MLHGRAEILNFLGEKKNINFTGNAVLSFILRHLDSNVTDKSSKTKVNLSLFLID
jgi:hypothetical protein